MVKLPNKRQRITLVGRTGTGKTQAGVWHLSNAPIDSMPYLIIDYKTDELINSIERAEHVDLNWRPKKKDKGIFIIHPMPKVDDAAVNDLLARLWERENCGVMCDEGYMVTGLPMFDTLLTQGRSKRIPMIVLSQRPAWISRFAFSEADFFQIFALNDKRDKQTIESFSPIDMDEIIPDFHSYYYDVKANRVVIFSPVPDAETILKRIDAKLPRRMRTI